MEEFVPAPRAPIGRNETPDTIAGWKALAERLLTRQTCALHRNAEISSRYAWINRILPSCFEWAAMAAIASHRVRLTLYPLRLDPDRGRRIDIPPGHPGHRNLLPTEDVNLIKATNNACGVPEVGTGALTSFDRWSDMIPACRCGCCT